MKEIKLTKGFTAQVDDEDFEYLNQCKWNTCLTKTGHIYAGRTLKTILMHRIIMSAPTDKQVDHIDHNGLNNQKSNLRLCTNAQNSMNRIPYGTSKYLGVYKVKNRKSSFMSQIKVNGVHKYLGCFKNEIDAAKSYDIAAKKYNGEFANLNFK